MNPEVEPDQLGETLAELARVTEQLKAAREALAEAARSLEAAAGAGRPESMMPDLETLRPWAKARARLARAALKEATP